MSMKNVVLKKTGCSSFTTAQMERSPVQSSDFVSSSRVPIPSTLSWGREYHCVTNVVLRRRHASYYYRVDTSMPYLNSISTNSRSSEFYCSELGLETCCFFLEIKLLKGRYMLGTWPAMCYSHCMPCQWPFEVVTDYWWVSLSSWYRYEAHELKLIILHWAKEHN